MPSHKLTPVLEARLAAVALAQGKSPELLLTELLDQAIDSPKQNSSIVLDNLINIMPEYIFMVERDSMRILYCNDMFAKIIGHSGRETVQGKTVFDCFPAEQTAYFVEQNRAVFAGENLHLFETLPLREGLRHLETHKLALKNAAGETFALLGVSHDITDLENAREELRRLSEELQISEERYRVISELSADFAFAYRRGADGRFQLEWITDAFATLTGYDAAEFQALQERQQLVHPDDIKNYRQSLLTLTETPQEMTVPIHFIHKDGNIIYLRTHYKSVLDTVSGQVEIVYGSARDTSQQTLAEASLEQERLALHEIMRTSPAGLTVLDANGTISFANTRAKAILGLEPSHILGKSYNDPQWKITDFVGNSFPDEELPFRQVLTKKCAVYDIRHAIEWPDGRRVFLSVSGAPILDAAGDFKSAVLHIEDISLRVQSEAQIQENLEQERQLNELKTRFISTITHELRTPLTIIKTSLDLVQRHYDGSNLEGLNQRIKKIYNQVDFLKRITDEVAFIHKQEHQAYTIHWQTIRLQEFVDGLLEELAMAYPKMSPIRCEIAAEAEQINLDETLLHHILLNLLSNAIKYTPSERAMIQLIARREGAKLVLEVADNGIGIPEAEQKNLFKSFSRASNVGGIGGIGLGLAIVKMAVDTFGGTITVQSVEGQGCHFTVSLPQDWVSV